MSDHDATDQIEQTLQSSREEIEAQISIYRMVLFALGILITIGTHLLRPDLPIHPAWAMIANFIYAVVVWQVIRRIGATHTVINVVAVLDIIVSCNAFVVGQIVAPEQNEVGKVFVAFILTAMLGFLLLLNSLRYSRSSAVLSGIAAVIVFVSVCRFTYGPHIAQFPTAVILGLSAVVSYWAAIRSRRNLDRFARFQLLRRYLSPAAVERVLKDNPDEALALGGELRTVTLLSADLRDFTAMSEKLSASDVVDQLNEYHGTMLDEIDRHGGILDKFIGDGTLAVFGLGPGRQEHAVDAGAAAAVACARDMQTALVRLNEKRQARGLVPLRMGIGIHTGQVIAGNIGAPGRRIEFTVIGDSVNTAARLEGLTKEAGVSVLLTVSTAARLSSRDGLTSMPPMHAKGKEGALEVMAIR